MSHHKHKRHRSHSQDDEERVSISKPGKNGRNGERGCRGKRGHKGDHGVQGIQGIPGTNGTNGTNAVLSSHYLKQETDTQKSGFSFSPLGILTLGVSTTVPNSKLLIWASFSSANSTAQATNFFRVTINGISQEGCATSFYGADPVAAAGSLVLSVPAPVPGLYVVQVEWATTGVGDIGFVRPNTNGMREHADLLVMETTN